MAKKIIGDVTVAVTAKSQGKYLGTSVNDTLLADKQGELALGIDQLVPTAEYGDVVFFDSLGNTIPNKTTRFARIIDSDNELAAEKNYIDSFQTVFNSWYRFSCGANGLFPSNPSEIAQWSYNPTTDTITNPLNSTTLIGFVSPDKYTAYDFEVQVKSSAGDDDWIGIVLAFVKENGKEFTLTASRATNSNGTNMPNSVWSVYYNHMQADQKMIANGEPNYAFTKSGFWNAYPNGCKIKANRTGNIITVSTTDLVNNPDTYVAELTIDLDSDPVLQRFMNPSSVGYSCQSQGNSTWKTLFFSGGQNVIYDVRNGAVWSYSNNAWAIKPSSSMYTDLSLGYIYSNSRVGKAYYYNYSGDMRRIISTNLSSEIGNTLQENGDGLYKGSEIVSGQKIFFVNSISGSDGADGATVDTPLKTIQEACSRLIAGTTGYQIVVYSGGSYEISKPIELNNVGVQFSIYPIPDWVPPYLAANPTYEWTAAKEITRPRLYMSQSNMEQTPSGYVVNAFNLQNYAYASFVGFMIDPGLPPAMMVKNGFFGDVDQSGTLYLAHCEFRCDGIYLLSEGNTSESNVQMYRCRYDRLNRPSFNITSNKLELSALGDSGNFDSTDPALNPFWEHPLFSNPNFTTQVRDSINGVKWYNGVPINCTYPHLYGGPTYP